MNYLALLGWSSPTDQEILSFEDLFHQFSFDRVRRMKYDYENVFKADPDTWLKANVLTLDMPRGLETRAALEVRHEEVHRRSGRAGKALVCTRPDPKRARTGSPGKPARQAYLLTPAVEKYVAEYAEGDEFLTAIRSDEAFAAVEASPAYIEAAYVQYLRGKTTVPDTSVGHTSVKKERGGEGFNPDFVFTDVMNGCAWAITDDEEDEDSFTAWHYQSPSSNKAEASAFRHDKAPTDWFGVEEYGSGEHRGPVRDDKPAIPQRPRQERGQSSQRRQPPGLEQRHCRRGSSRALDLEGTGAARPSPNGSSSVRPKSRSTSSGVSTTTPSRPSSTPPRPAKSTPTSPKCSSPSVATSRRSGGPPPWLGYTKRPKRAWPGEPAPAARSTPCHDGILVFAERKEQGYQEEVVP